MMRYWLYEWFILPRDGMIENNYLHHQGVTLVGVEGELVIRRRDGHFDVQIVVLSGWGAPLLKEGRVLQELFCFFVNGVIGLLLALLLLVNGLLVQLLGAEPLLLDDLVRVNLK